MHDAEFNSLVEAALEKSADERATADDVASRPPPSSIQVNVRDDAVELRAQPGPMRLSDWGTAALTAALALISITGTALTWLYFRDAPEMAVVVAMGWIGFLAMLQQLIRVRSPVVLHGAQEALSVSHRGLLGWRARNFPKAEMASIQIVISSLAMSDESTVFDLALITRRPRPGALPGTTEIAIAREVLIACRSREQLDWIAAKLRRVFGVPDLSRKAPSIANRPRWPKALLNRLREQPLSQPAPPPNPAADIGVCSKCGHDLRSLGDRRSCPECREPFRFNRRGERIG